MTEVSAARAGGAPEALAPAPGHPRFPLIDGLRALAALSVLASHVLFLALGTRVPGIFGALGISGVSVFFVISGFVLYRPFVAARLTGAPEPSLSRYLRRRALRIFPAYWLALTVLSIYPGGLVGTFGHNGPIFYALLQYWFPHLRGGGLPQAWSLSIEITWYGLLAIIAVLTLTLASRRAQRAETARGRGSVGRELAVLVALALVRLAYQPFSGGPFDALLGFLDWFLGGMALAVASAALVSRGNPAGAGRLLERFGSVSWLAAFGVYCTFAFRLDHHPPTFADHLLQGVFAVLVVLPAVFDDGRGAVRKLLSLPLIAWVGLVSYGIYLWHAPIVLALARSHWLTHLAGARMAVLGATTLAISVACAAASYYALERPLLQLGRGVRPAVPATRPPRRPDRALRP